MKPHRVILSAEGWVEELNKLLEWIKPHESSKEIRRCRDAIVNLIVLACTERWNAIENIELASRRGGTYYSGSAAYNVPYSYTVSASGVVNTERPRFAPTVDIRTALRNLGMALFFQINSMGLYSEKGILQYSFRKINDPFFNDVALDHIQLLTWNGAVYETHQ
jgi:hypothetical protein